MGSVKGVVSAQVIANVLIRTLRPVNAGVFVTNSVVASAVGVGITGAFAVRLYIDTGRLRGTRIIVCLTIAATDQSESVIARLRPFLTDDDSIVCAARRIIWVVAVIIILAGSVGVAFLG